MSGMTGKDRTRLAMYSFSHLLVDMCCFYVLYAGVISCFGDNKRDIAVLGFLMYNCIAFGAQVFLGRLADKRKNHTGMAALGCLILSAAVLAVYLPAGIYTSGPPYAVTILCALAAAAGNALFHTGSGTDTLLRAGGRMAPNGIFVAPGAIGVAAGRLIGMHYGLYSDFNSCFIGARREDYVHAVMIICALAAYIMCGAAKRMDNSGSGEKAPEYRFSRPGRSASFIIVSAMTVVTLRALVGSYIPVRPDVPQFAVSGAELLPVIFALCAACGKALGGAAGDRFGARVAAVTSLTASAFLFAAGIWFPALTLAAVLLFNFTMPVTLCAVASEMPRRYGEAFGLTTIGLLIGSLPEYVIKPGYCPKLMITLPLIIVSAVLMYLCCAGKSERE